MAEVKGKSGKVVLESVSKDKLRCAFSFEKSWEVVGAIDEMLDKLGLSDRFDNGLKDMMSCYNFGPDADIKKWHDEVFNIRNDYYSVDVFFGGGKIVLVVNSRDDRQKLVSDAVFEFADFEENLNKFKDRGE